MPIATTLALRIMPPSLHSDLGRSWYLFGSMPQGSEPTECRWGIRRFRDRNGLRFSQRSDDVGRPDGDEHGWHGDCCCTGDDSRDVLRLAHLEGQRRGRMREQWSMPVKLPAQRVGTASVIDHRRRA